MEGKFQIKFLNDLIIKKFLFDSETKEAIEAYKVMGFVFLFIGNFLCFGI